MCHDICSGSIDLWKQLLGRLKDRLDRRKKERERTESNLSVENQEEVEREEVEEEEEEKGEEEMSGDNLHPPDEQDSSNVSSKPRPHTVNISCTVESS